MKKIMIYDDDGEVARELQESLEALPLLGSDYEICALDNKRFEKSMEVLKERRCQIRKDGEWPSGLETDLDETAIFVIDYDLFNINAFLTGEDVAYSARCFSTCGLIVGLNQYYEVDFDLTLKGHPESFADLNIRGEQLSNPNLWGEGGNGFRPWYWPLLPQFEQNLAKRVDDVERNLDQSIWDVLDFDPGSFDILPRSISQFIGSEPTRTTFRDFVKESGNGMRPQDSKEAGDDILARVGAARISKWLERLVLPELDILVDAPHLVSRYPSLMNGNKCKIGTWNKTTRLLSYKELGLDTDKIEPFRFKDFWLSRPAWFWDKVREHNEILEVREPWETIRPGGVFCEDLSKFDEGDHREFVAKVESPFARRFVKELDGIKYQPRVRFSL